ncbi:MAG: hypothetical protein AB7O71_10985, partial [Hyphomicrobiaceae bacterium]
MPATAQMHPGLRLAQSKEAGGENNAKAALEALIKEDEERRAKDTKAEKSHAGADGEQELSGQAKAAAHGEISVLTAAAKAEKGKKAPIPAVDEETLSLYPTAAQCGQCHTQIYEEWSSSQHA